MALLAFCSVCNTYRSRKNKKTINKQQKSVCIKCGADLDKSKKFRINVSTPEGKRITEVVEGTLTFARNVEAKTKSDVSRNKHLGLQKAPILDDVAELYLKWARENKKDWKHDEGRWNLHIKPVLKNKKMDQITPMDVSNLLSGMKKYKVGFTKKEKNRKSVYIEVMDGIPAPATKRQVLVLIKRIYNWGIKRGLYRGENPATKVETPKINNQITECLTTEDLHKLITVLDNWDNRLAAFIVKFALYLESRIKRTLFGVHSQVLQEKPVSGH